MKTLLRTSAVLLATAAFATAAPLIVPGSANIFGAGQASPPATGVGGPGTLPPELTFLPGAGQSASFSSVTGLVSSGGFNFGPDGEGPFLLATDMPTFQSVSGIKADRGFFLIGIFLDANVPSGTAPAGLNFTSTGLTPDFLTLSPLLNQLFYVGDGKTGVGGTGSTQTFNVPLGATRLFLGIADGQFNGTALFGLPGNYQDNTGAFTVGVDVVPEPTGLALLVAGASLLGLCRREKGRCQNLGLSPTPRL